VGFTEKLVSDKLTYKDAGVDIENADATKREMAASLKSSDPRVLNSHGAFASLFQANFPGISEPVLVLKAEEPGSKQLLAFQYGFVRSICFDLINHLINDIAVMGAIPLAVLDTIVCASMKREHIVALVDGMAEACRMHECTLVGGETSEQPGVLNDGRYVLCANVVGVADRRNIIDGKRIKAGDLVLGLEASGAHTNGYTLIRKLIARDEKILEEKVSSSTFLQAVMEPHRSYLKFLKPLFQNPALHGLAHITGGGIEGNLDRILPSDLSAEIDLSQIKVLELFKFIRQAGNVPDEDMRRTFNLGVGVTLVCEAAAASKIQAELSKLGLESYPIGRIVKGDKTVRFVSQLSW